MSGNDSYLRAGAREETETMSKGYDGWQNDYFDPEPPEDDFPMTASEYQQLAARTLIDKPDFDIPDVEIMLVWNAIGLAGEAGEVAELVKKGVFHRHGVDDEFRRKMKKELGDVTWYMAAMCTKLDLDMGEVMQANIDKLLERYPNGYSSEDSKRRVDVATRTDPEHPIAF